MNRWVGTILGEPASKANSRRLATTGRGQYARRRVIKSEKAMGWVESAKRQLMGMRAKPLLEGRLCFIATIFYASERPDLDESLVLDVLQGFVYANDRQVREKHLFHLIDRENPRVEMVVYEGA